MEAQEVIERFCQLQALVQECLGDYEHAADCFCGKSGYWDQEGYGGTYAEGYRNEGTALEFIEAAVKEKLGVK